MMWLKTLNIFAFPGKKFRVQRIQLVNGHIKFSKIYLESIFFRVCKVYE